MGGPLWSHPIHDPTFVEELLQIIEEKPLSDLDTTSFKRKATTPAKEPVSCQRFSLDLEEDLQTLLEARAAPHVANVDHHESNVAVSGNAMNKLFEMEDENKSNNANTIKSIPYNFSTKASCDETIFECQQQRTSDESFMALEKMCDKTASDPNSTLFKYIHSENKDMVKEDAKKRSADGNYFKIPCKQVPFPYWMVNMAFAFSPSITDKVEEIYARKSQHTMLVERFFNSSPVVMVTAEKPNCLQMLQYINCVYGSNTHSI
ncbi:uncharacterized protein [Eurosta solidaginis]